MKDFYKSTIRPFLMGVFLAFISLLVFYFKGCLPAAEIVATTTDTLYVNKPYREVVVKEVEVPKTVYIYKTDTVFRKSMEKDTLISALEFTPKKAFIHTITPKGVPMVKEYDLTNYRSMHIDHEGRLGIKKIKHLKRKKLLKTLGKVGIFTGGLLLGQKLGK